MSHSSPHAKAWRLPALLFFVRIMIEEYLYIFDIKKSKWYIGYWRDNYNLRSLESVLHSKKLLEQLFSEEYTEEYMLEFHKRCLNA